MSTHTPSTPSITVFYGHPNRGNLKVSTAVAAHGLSLLKAPPCDIHTVVIADHAQPAYGVYISNLPAFLKAYVVKEAVSLHDIGFDVNIPAELMIPACIPPMIVTFRRPLNDSETVKIASFGYQVVKAQAKMECYVFSNLTLAQVVEIKRMDANDICPAIANTVNMSSLRTWVFVVKTLSLVLRVHTYPAYQNDDVYFSGDEEEEVIAEGFSNKRQRMDIGTRSDILTVLDHEDEGDVEQSVHEESIKPTVTRHVNLTKAKPPSRDTLPWGTADEIPNADGLLFPYISDLSSYDIKTVPDFFADYLLRFLGPSHEAMTRRLDDIRSAFGTIGKTDSGKMLAHLCKTLRVALQAQARLFPIFNNGIYEGSIVSGSKFSLYVNQISYKPGTYSQLQEAVKSANLHSAVLKKILGLCGIGDRFTEVTSMRALSRVLKEVPITEDLKQQLLDLAHNLTFPQKYWPVNSTTILKFLELVLTPLEAAIDDDIPLHPTQLFYVKRAHSLLSAFGFSAPSFTIPNTSVHILKSSLQSPVPSTFCVRSTSLSTAIIDFDTMVSNQSIRNNPTNLSRTHQDFSIKDQKIEIWASLVKVCNRDPLPQINQDLRVIARPSYEDEF